jgi:hypothetical protein
MTSKTTQWSRLLPEAAAIVGSILLAFAIDAWWDGKVERDREQSILADLASEFEQNKDRLAYMQGGHEERSRIALHLLEVSRGRAERPPRASLDTMVYRSLMQAGSFDPIQGVFSAVSASGELALIRDDSLRYALGSWPSVLQDAREEEQWIFRDVQNHYMHFLWERVSPTEALATESETDTDFGDPPAMADYDNLFGDATFENLLAAKAWNEDWAASELEELALLIDEVLRLLAKSQR